MLPMTSVRDGQRGRARCAACAQARGRAADRDAPRVTQVSVVRAAAGAAFAAPRGECDRAAQPVWSCSGLLLSVAAAGERIRPLDVLTRSVSRDARGRSHSLVTASADGGGRRDRHPLQPTSHCDAANKFSATCALSSPFGSACGGRIQSDSGHAVDSLPNCRLAIVNC
jgi:hypothetical protein